jgi:ubiquinone/menaquinone biosynthesis C-methylase UbiE
MTDSTLIPSALKAAAMKARALREFDDWAGSYDRSLLHHFLFRPSYRVFLEEIAEWQRQRTAAFRVLDIGCGTGELAAMLAKSSWPVEAVGLDYVPAMCSQARQKAAGHGLGPRARFIAGDSEFLPFAAGSFDVITCSNSFHHYPHQQAVVHEVRRLLRPGGMFILIDGFRDNVIGWVAFDVIIAKVEKHVHHAPWSVIDGYFRTAGFQRIRRRKFNFWMPLCATIGYVD